MQDFFNVCCDLGIVRLGIGVNSFEGTNPLFELSALLS